MYLSLSPSLSLSFQINLLYHLFQLIGYSHSLMDVIKASPLYYEVRQSHDYHVTLTSHDSCADDLCSLIEIGGEYTVIGVAVHDTKLINGRIIVNTVIEVILQTVCVCVYMYFHSLSDCVKYQFE